MNLRGIAGLFLLIVTASVTQADQWVTEGFEAFRKGTFGNGGQNLYVSRAGVLQRIYQYDLDHNGWFDLVFANCQDHHESAPSYLYGISGGRPVALHGQGSRSGCVVDLNGDGYQDLVVCGFFDMVSPFASTDIYYGGVDGDYSENRHICVQTPFAEDCWYGRFDGSSRPALVFAMPKYGIVRIYRQGELGFEWSQFTDLPIRADLLTATDLDADGFDDLVVRRNERTKTTIYWGGTNGLDVAEKTILPELPESEIYREKTSMGLQSDLERKVEARRLLQSVVWNGRHCFTLSTGRKMLFFSGKDRRIVRELEVDEPLALAVSVGDFDEDGLDDLAFASRSRDPADERKQVSHVWMNAPDGFLPENRIAVETDEACCVDSCGGRILIGCATRERTFTNDALLFEFRNGRLDSEPKRFKGEDVRRAFIVRNPEQEDRVFLVCHYSRSSVGYDRSYVYWGDEKGYDRTRMLAVPSWCAVSALAADLDDDGWAELVIDNNSENSLDLDPGHHVHHFGPGGFEPERSQTLKTDIGWGSVVADFDRDGYLDLITVADLWHSIRYFHGGPTGLGRHEDVRVEEPRFPETKSDEEDESDERRSPQTSKPISYGGLRWMIAADFNLDGWLDLALPSCRGRSYVLWGGADGFSMDRHQEFATHAATGVAVADLNRDGYPELLFGGLCIQPTGEKCYREPHHSFVHLYWNGSKGLSDDRKMILRADMADHMCVADWNGDGWLDVFTGSYESDIDRDINSFLYWNRCGRFSQFDRQEFVTHAACGCLGVDFNEDGYIDLAVANHKIYSDHVGDSYVWWNGPEGFLPTRRTDLPTCGPHGMNVVEPGNILTRGPEEHYLSESYVIERGCTVAGVNVTADIPDKTWVTALVRVNGGTWQKPVGVDLKRGDVLQYRLELGAKNSLRTPRVSRVTVEFTCEK